MIGAVRFDRPRPERRLAGFIRRGDTTAIAVAQAPATANRAVRRSYGLWGSIWRWDLNAADDTRRTYVPRYIRRHYSARVMLTPSTRRERRHRARILRVSRQKGIIQ